jgi:hypothetical protein
MELLTMYLLKNFSFLCWLGSWLFCVGLLCAQETKPAEETKPFELEPGFRSLFNGKDLTGWEGSGKDVEKSWVVIDGTLRCTGKSGPWLRSKEEFGDFELRLEYRVTKEGNSGIYIRVPQSGSHHGKDAGVEVQILDDHSPKFQKLRPDQFAGSMYSVLAGSARVAKPTGEWNTLTIRCEGTKYQVIHNGTKIIDTDPTATPELGKRRVSGFLGIQNHNKEVWYRNIRIQPLAAKAAP